MSMRSMKPSRSRSSASSGRKGPARVLWLPVCFCCFLWSACLPDLGAELPPEVPGRADGGGVVVGGGADGGGSGGADGGSSNADLLKKGEVVFFSAGGQGCSSCHGADGKGDVGPNIRSKSRTDVANCLATVDQMAFLHLSDEEIDAVSAFLAWLKTQP